jgi:ABC-type proline/glycine betaine transport system ATPase subunit
MNKVIKNKNYLKLNSTFIISLSMVAAIVFVSFSLMPQQSYAENYKLNILITNQDEINTKADLSIKTNDDTQETTVKLNDDPEEIKETIAGEPRDKVKVCLEDSDFKDCQTKNLPKDDDSTIKFKLEYEA